MDKKPLKTGRLIAFGLLIVLSILMNYFGAIFASTHKLPLWLDSAGTVLAAYLGGPVCGALVGATGNLIAYIVYGDSWAYAIVSIGIGIVVGVAARRKGFGSMLSILTTAAMLTITATLLALPLNIIFGNNSTGNMWGDAVARYLSERGLPRYFALPVGQLYVELLDKLLILLVLYLLMHLNRLIEKMRHRRRDRENEEQAEKNALMKEEKAAAIHFGALLLAVSLCLSGTAGEARAESTEEIQFNDYVQTIYSSTNGLPCGEANDIAQTNDGILWIGTYAGLYRYNGKEFRWMDNYESIRNVNCLYVDEEGRLWVGTNDNGLSILINEQIANVVDQSMGLPANSVRSIIRSSDGYYYIGTTSSMQVLSLNYGMQRITTLSEVMYADHSAADDEGRIAAVTSSGMLYLIRKGQILSSRRLTGGTSAFKSCTFDPEGYLLAATTGNEIYRFDVSKDWFEEKEVWTCGDLVSIKNLAFQDSGVLFITADNGVGFRTPEGRFERLNTTGFNNSVDNMLVDYQGNMWFTSSRLGLLRMAPSDFRDIYGTAGMTDRVVNTTVFWQGVYYFGTDKGLDAADEEGKQQIRNELTEQLAGIRIRCMMPDSRGSLWICTYGSGLIEVEKDGTQHLYNNETGANGNRTRVVKELSDGTILSASDTGLTYIRDHEIIHTIGQENGKISSMILTLTEMPDGTILAGTDGNGIAVLENGEVSRMLTRKDGLSSEVILRTVRDEKGNGVFVVTSNGLCYMDADGSIRTLDNFPYYNNYDIWIQDQEDLYVLSSAGIYVTKREELLSGKANIKCDLLDRRRGLNSSLTANAWTWYDTEKGELYLACDSGAFAINIEGLNSGASVFRMNVPYVRMDGDYRRIERNTTLTVPRGTGKLEINPEVINYTIQDPYVGYKMEGFESDWTIVPQNSLGSIVYTNLPAGDYTFRLAVFDNDQESILAERTYSISKEKELYDNGWFVVYLLLVPMFTVGWVTWLLVKRREERIERELAEANRIAEMGKQTVGAIANAVDAKDKLTGGHSRRVALYSRLIAKESGMSEKDCQEIEWAANMHDIGKIAIPDSVLNKNSRLTDEEYAIMKSHTEKGAEILKDFTLLDHVIEGAEFHHERYDGRGYPKGLKGEEIPLFARVIGVADAFDAMTANRVYRAKMDFGYVLGELEKGRGTQFDPQFVDVLLKLIRDGVIDLNTLYGTNTEQQEGKKEEPKPEEAKAGEKKEEPNIEEAKAGEKKEEPKKEEPKPGTNGDAGKQEG